jgi:hypothetical protein
VSAIAEGTDRTLWVASNKNVFALRGGKIVHRYTEADGLFAAGTTILYADSFGSVYAGDGHHLVRFNGTRFESVPSPGLGNFVSLLTDHRGNLWMASGGLHGISRTVGGKADLLTTKDGLASNDARVLFEDNTHDIWIGTIAGLQRLHDGVFTTYTEEDGLPRGENQYDAVFEDKQNDIWVGSLEDGVARGRDGRFERFSVKEGLKRGQVRGFVDTDGGIAVALSDYGLFQLRGKRFAKVPRLPHGYITSPAIDEAGVHRLARAFNSVPEVVKASFCQACMATGPSGNGRQVSDVSADADPETGVPVVVTSGGVRSAEAGVGGTSLATPIFSAI